jgi:hypothetical protein
MDAEGNVVDGVMGVNIDIDPTGFPKINVKLHPKYTNETMDPLGDDELATPAAASSSSQTT